LEGKHGRYENARLEHAWQSDETQTVESAQSEHREIVEWSECFAGNETAGFKSKRLVAIEKRSYPGGRRS
jgi:hypothetical protein